MANQFNLSVAFAAFLLATSAFLVANAGDPDILTDFVVPPSVSPDSITPHFFRYTGLRQIPQFNLTGPAVTTEVTMKEFPALNGQAVSMAVIKFPPGGVNPPHIHPRAGELFLVLRGTLKVGFVDTNNRLFVQTLRGADMFVFPKGLVHFQVNVNSSSPASAIGIFGSASAGTVELGEGIFGSGISEKILPKAFNTDKMTMAKILKGFK